MLISWVLQLSSRTVEPFEGLHGQLKAAIQAAGLSRKYTIAPVSIEDDVALEKFGVSESKFDTIVCVQVSSSLALRYKLTRDSVFALV